MFSDPVVGRDFFGRQSILELLIKRANALKSGYRQNVAIIGHQQVGKTSILRQFLHVYKDSQVLPIYVEIKLQALDYFVDQFIRSLLYQYLIQTGPVDPTESLSTLSKKANPFIPKTVARIADIAQLLRHRHAEEAYSLLFELTAIIKQETGKNCIVILDEFHKLGEFGIKNAFSDFGKRIMVQKDTMYVLSSSSFSASRRILAEKLSLLFGHFERVYLEPFDFETSFDFIDKKLDPVTIPPALKCFLVAFTDGHPFFLQTIMTRVRELSLAKGESEVSPRTAGEVLLKLLYESQGALYQYFLSIIKPWAYVSPRSSHVLILTELAKGKNKLKDVAAAVNRSQKETTDQINELIEHEIIIKTGVFYRFHNKILKFWLREVYEKKELSLLGTDDKIEAFLTRIDQMIAEYAEMTKGDISDTVMRLFESFRNEIIEIGEKKRQLPHFTEFIRQAKGPIEESSARRIIAQGHGRCWVCKITEERATEKEVLDLVTDGGHARTTQTKVLIALNGLDDNARLLAKEKKVLTLGLQRINMLLDLYGQSPIVRSSASSTAA